MSSETMARLAQSKTNAAVGTSEKAPDEALDDTSPAPVAVKEKEYQSYRSSLPNQRIALESGRLLRIVDHKYITDDGEEIEFLDHQIKKGFPFLSKTGVVTTSDLDPMNSLRQRIIAEAIASGTVQAVPSPELKDTEAQTLTPAGTAALAPLAAGSNSGNA